MLDKKLSGTTSKTEPFQKACEGRTSDTLQSVNKEVRQRRGETRWVHCAPVLTLTPARPVPPSHLAGQTFTPPLLSAFNNPHGSGLSQTHAANTACASCTSVIEASCG